MNTPRNQAIIDAFEAFGPERWVEALQDPKYRHMRFGLGFSVGPVTKACCLGVLVDAAEAPGCTADVLAFHADERISVNYDYVEGRVPIASASNTASIPIELLPSWMREPQMTTLMEINDAPGTADYVEQIKYIEEHIVPRWRARQNTEVTA